MSLTNTKRFVNQPWFDSGCVAVIRFPVDRDVNADARLGFGFHSCQPLATPSQLALAWLLAQKPFIVPIPGTRNMDHLQENLGALNIQLTPTDLTDLETEISNLTVHGDRINKMQMEYVDETV